MVDTAALLHGGNRLLANDESRTPELPGSEVALVGAAIGKSLYRGMSPIRLDHVPGQSVLGCVITPMQRSSLSLRRSCLFFGNVNQVLVRLWARVTQDLSVVCG